ncbi:hypothetical protein P167DRAFT_561361 [Morchella conica CCBAS932]|uniref:Uncharacterized protein n=1 Tax=Morchella conica CCBAS932 TaxID=1392247 RepID=A0A3N4LIH8_9PEZI|nr:hypothetical protein P167DRAFT_561361 [Morchella conica CCBAS932]
MSREGDVAAKVPILALHPLVFVRDNVKIQYWTLFFGIDNHTPDRALSLILRSNSRACHVGVDNVGYLPAVGKQAIFREQISKSMPIPGAVSKLPNLSGSTRSRVSAEDDTTGGVVDTITDNPRDNRASFDGLISVVCSGSAYFWDAGATQKRRWMETTSIC